MLAAFILLGGWMAEATAQTTPSSDLLSPVVLLPVKKPDLLDPQWQKHLCDLPALICDDSAIDLQLFQAKDSRKGDAKSDAISDGKGHKSGQYFLLFNHGLMLAQLEWSRASVWQLGAVWDFRSYTHSHPLPVYSEEHSSLKLAPALYPSAPGKWAVAVISSASTGYSGGGAGCEVADFVELPAQSGVISADERIVSGVPFSDWTMIRACFSEGDYRRMGQHCHDETRSWLTFKAKPSGQVEHYDWLLSWHEENWPAGESKKNRTVETKLLELKATDSPVVQQKKFEKWAVCTGLGGTE